MTESDIKFQWADAWLLLATGLAAQNGSAALAAVVSCADGIQHAIPTQAEMNGAIGRLSRLGYLRYEAGRITLSETGAEFIRQSAAGHRGLLDHQHVIEQLLDAEPWSDKYHPDNARCGEAEAVSTEDWKLLMRPYRIDAQKL